MTPQQTTTYKAALREARSAFSVATKRLVHVEAEARSLKGEIARLRQTITALAALCSESPGFDKFGITEACMEAMDNITYTASTAEVVRNLDSMGFNLDSQKNAAASVHSVLSRLAEKGVVKKIDTKDAEGKELAGWRGPNYDPESDQFMAEISGGEPPF